MNDIQNEKYYNDMVNVFERFILTAKQNAKDFRADSETAKILTEVIALLETSVGVLISKRDKIQAALFRRSKA